MSSLKLIIMGVGGVGKSAITTRFIHGQYTGRYDPTIEDSYKKTVTVGGKAVELNILDTAGQEQYSALRETFMHTGNAFILVYSIIDDDTFAKLSKIRDDILKVHPDKNVPMILIGNKCDMESERAVSEEEGKALATQFDGCDFMEVSAKSNVGVNEMFTKIVETVFAKDANAGAGAADGTVLGAGTEAKTAGAAKKKKKCTLL